MSPPRCSSVKAVRSEAIPAGQRRFAMTLEIPVLELQFPFRCSARITPTGCRHKYRNRANDRGRPCRYEIDSQLGAASPPDRIRSAAVLRF